MNISIEQHKYGALTAKFMRNKITAIEEQLLHEWLCEDEYDDVCIQKNFH